MIFCTVQNSRICCTNLDDPSAEASISSSLWLFALNLDGEPGKIGLGCGHRCKLDIIIFRVRFSRNTEYIFILVPSLEFSVIDKDSIGSARFSQNLGLREILIAILRRNTKTFIQWQHQNKYVCLLWWLLSGTLPILMCKFWNVSF